MNVKASVKKSLKFIKKVDLKPLRPVLFWGIALLILGVASGAIFTINFRLSLFYALLFSSYLTFRWPYWKREHLSLSDKSQKLERHSDEEHLTKEIGKVLLDSCVKLGIIQTPLTNLKLKTERSDKGVVVLTLQGAAEREQKCFAEALQEILDPAANPRYLIRPRLYSESWRKDDCFYAVPKIFEKNKHDANTLKMAWEKAFGASKLIYTRSKSGKKALIKAKTDGLIPEFHPKVEKVILWQ